MGIQMMMTRSQSWRDSTVGLEPGFVSDQGQGARGYTQWVAGTLHVGGARFRQAVRVLNALMLPEDQLAKAPRRCGW